jgi:hypothetical protein
MQQRLGGWAAVEFLQDLDAASLRGLHERVIRLSRLGQQVVSLSVQRGELIRQHPPKRLIVHRLLVGGSVELPVQQRLADAHPSGPSTHQDCAARILDRLQFQRGLTKLHHRIDRLILS